MRRCCEMLRAETSSTMELLLPLLCLCVLSCSGSTSAAGAEPERIDVKEGRDVTLSCSISVEDPTRPTYKRFVWKKDGQREVYAYDGTPLLGQDVQFRGRVSFPAQLEKGSASIIITNTKVADTGNYTCESGPNHKQDVRIYLRVGTASKPFIPTPDVTPNGVLLQCVVHGETFKPDVQWKDSNRKIIHAQKPQVSERGGSYSIILKTTVAESGNYSCVATQEEISHQIAAQIHAPPPGPAGFSKEQVGGIVGGVAVGFLLIGVVIGYRCKRKRQFI